MPMVLLEQIVEGANARTVAVAAAAEEGLRLSIAANGVLQPILLRPLRSRGTPFDGTEPSVPVGGKSNNLEIVIGNRRVRAARALGLSEIPAEIREMTDHDVRLAQLAENMQRERMHPTDQWRGISALIMDDGMTIEQAAGALGFDERTTRRMERLGRLDRTLLALAEIDMPADATLRTIARAPAKLQASVAKGRDLRIARGEIETVNWSLIAERCQTRRIDRAAAIFDVKAARGIAWDEDLFAEPGADDQFTTTDIGPFMTAQTKALEQRVAELVKAKKRAAIAPMLDDFSVKLPAGFRRVWDGKPDRLRRHETAFHAIKVDGWIVAEVGLDTQAERETEAKKKTRQAERGREREPDDDSDEDAEDSGLDDDAEDAGEPAEAPVKPPFTKAGLGLLAAARTGAIRTALDTTPMDPGTVLALLVLALDADNVSIRNPDWENGDLSRRVLAPGGNLLDLSDADISAIGQTAIGRVIRVGAPFEAGTSSANHSGRAAEWIGAAIQAGDHLPRFDTPEFLATAALPELKRAAADAGLKETGTAAALRDRLAGHAPNYRPEQAVFGAPTPKEKAHA